jgi:ubiquinone/menaquinone biosynthesis C-methylase UbiE
LSASLVEYYGRRASEYEQVYKKPERQADLQALTLLLQQLLAGEDVLELACGTGFWTEAIASVVRSLVATDVSPEVLALARGKRYPSGRVRLALANAHEPRDIEGCFTAGFAAFWWSHVPRDELPRFLGKVHRRLGRGARLVFCDNRYVEGSSTPLSRVDQAGNTFQQRRLATGDQYEVLKNFPSAAELNALIRAQGGADVSLQELTHYWCVSYRIGTITP